MENLDGINLDLEKWKMKVLPFISRLKPDLQMFFHDLFDDFQKEMMSSSPNKTNLKEH
jgi:hypothetical protein